MIPSFSMMGISAEFENMAKKVQAHANNIQEQAREIPSLIQRLEALCAEACNELEEEFTRIKETNS
jgi:hypothetical protein